MTTIYLPPPMPGGGLNNPPSGLVSIHGAGLWGRTLSVENTLADLDGLGSVGYQWNADGHAIDGATLGTFTIGQILAGHVLTVTASYVDGNGVTESVTSASLPVPPHSQAVEFIAYSWKAHTLLEGVRITGADFSLFTDGTGASTMGVDSPTLVFGSSRALPAPEVSATNSAVNVQDAIDILKMIVGLEVNGASKPLSPYQSLAADLDGNGIVNVSDAIAVLKHVVGLSAPDPAWHFLNEVDPDVPGKAGLNPGIAQNSVTAAMSGNGPARVGLVGYLSGDVNGSYAGAANAADLDLMQPDYFGALLIQHPGLSLSQFGIYP